MEEIGREPAGEGLEDEDAEAPDVGLLGDAAGGLVLGGLVGDHVLLRVLLVDHGDEAVVGEEGGEGGVEEDVGGLEVAVGGGEAGELVVEVE